MKRIGITGGIGSGKSTAAHYFEQRGYPVIYADPLAKQIMAEDKNVRRKLTSLLGEETYRGDGTLNRNFVASVIFSDPVKKRKLERIVHPAVIAAVDTGLNELEKSGLYRLAFVEAALLFDAGMDKMLDYVIVISTPESVRIDRIAKRDGVPAGEIKKRIDAQRTDDFLRKQADFVINNKKDVARLQEGCAFLESLFLAMEQTG